MNPIIEAINNKDFTLALQLLEKGAPWDMLEYQKMSAYRIIIQNNASGLLDFMIQKKHIELDIYMLDSFQNSIFSFFSQALFTAENIDMLKMIVSKIENINEECAGETLLSYGLKNKLNKDIIELIISSGGDVHYKNLKNETYLFHTTDIDIVELLLGYGIDVNHKNNQGRSIIFYAIRKSNIDLIRLFLDNGAQMNTQDSEGKTPYYTVLQEAVNPEIFEIAMQYEGPDFDLTDTDGVTLMFDFAYHSLFTCKEDRVLLSSLLDNGASVSLLEKDVYGREATSAQLLAKKDYETMEIIAQRDDFDTDFCDDTGNTWLHYVCNQETYGDANKAKNMYRKTKLLLEKGVDPNKKNAEDKSCIDYAQSENAKSKTLELLIKSI